MREFLLKHIQSMHFIINNRTKERLFVLDYIRTDESAKGKHLVRSFFFKKNSIASSTGLIKVGRLVLSSEDNETIFNSLKQAMIALAKKKMAAKQQQQQDLQQLQAQLTKK